MTDRPATRTRATGIPATTGNEAESYGQAAVYEMQVAMHQMKDSAAAPAITLSHGSRRAQCKVLFIS